MTMLKTISPTPPRRAERILGIDPGFGRLGYGIVEQTGGHGWRAVAYGCVETSAKKKFVERLKEIRDELEAIIQKYQPTRMAVEELFFFSNAKTAMDVGQARGVVLLVGIQHDLPIDELTPLQVKQGLTGYGRAEKDQMQKVVAMVLGLKEKIKSDDAADALAVAITAGQSLWVKRLSPP